MKNKKNMQFALFSNKEKYLKYKSSQQIDNAISWIQQNTIVDKNSFDSDSGIGYLYLKNGVTTIYGSTTQSNEYPFSFNTNITEVDFSNSYISIIGSNCFRHCESLEKVILPIYIKEINGVTFMYCRNLISITIPKYVSALSIETFSHCTNLEKIVLNNKPQTLPSGFVNYCENLKYFEIPDSVTKLFSYSFYNCTSLEYIICNPKQPPEINSTGAFTNTNISTLYVPDESKTLYENSDWILYVSEIKKISEFE